MRRLPLTIAPAPRPAKSLFPTESDASADAAIAEDLRAILASLAGATESPHARELRAKARSYQQVIERWSAVPATPAQREATGDLVRQLRGKVGEVAAHTAGSGSLAQSKK